MLGDTEELGGGRQGQMLWGKLRQVVTFKGKVVNMVARKLGPCLSRVTKQLGTLGHRSCIFLDQELISSKRVEVLCLCVSFNKILCPMVGDSRNQVADRAPLMKCTT